MENGEGRNLRTGAGSLSLSMWPRLRTRMSRARSRVTSSSAASSTGSHASPGVSITRNVRPPSRSMDTSWGCAVVEGASGAAVASRYVGSAALRRSAFTKDVLPAFVAPAMAIARGASAGFESESERRRVRTASTPHASSARSRALPLPLPFVGAALGEVGRQAEAGRKSTVGYS